jgi:hypothetical protein
MHSHVVPPRLVEELCARATVALPLAVHGLLNGGDEDWIQGVLLHREVSVLVGAKRHAPKQSHQSISFM